MKITNGEENCDPEQKERENKNVRTFSYWVKLAAKLRLAQYGFQRGKDVEWASHLALMTHKFR